MDPSELLFGVGSTLLQEGRAFVDASDQTNYNVKDANARDFEDDLSGSELPSEEESPEHDELAAAARASDPSLVRAVCLFG